MINLNLVIKVHLFYDSLPFFSYECNFISVNQLKVSQIMCLILTKLES